HLLATTCDHIRQIAFQAGFTDIRHFRGVFRRRFGVSPTTYRSERGLSRVR
ncbi:MAG: helix-turn-helix domain-containing protein, partial [Pyrinomonadaceae bacterium]